MIPTGAVRVPLVTAVEVSSGDNGCVAEPAASFHETSVNFPDVIVRTLGPDRTRPDGEQVEIHYCTMNPNGDYPFTEEFFHHLKLPRFPAKDTHSLVGIGTEPKAGKSVAGEIIHGFLGTLLNDYDVWTEC